MVIGDVVKVAVLRCSLSAMGEKLAIDKASEAGWSSVIGSNGVPFTVRPYGEATLVMPGAFFHADDEVAVYLRQLLGDALDLHDDERGIAWIAKPEAEDGAYDDVVAEAVWLEKVAADDERLTKASGSAFGSAARTLDDPKAKEKVQALAADNALDRASEKLEEKIEKRDDRGSMRRALGAAVGSSFLDSPLAQKPDKAGADDLGKKPSELADVLTRGSAGDKVSALESTLREAVEGDVAAAIGNIGDAAAPADAESDEPDEKAEGKDE